MPTNRAEKSSALLIQRSSVVARDGEANSTAPVAVPTENINAPATG
jgi:hypothetical protein